MFFDDAKPGDKVIDTDRKDQQREREIIMVKIYGTARSIVKGFENSVRLQFTDLSWLVVPRGTPTKGCLIKQTPPAVDKKNSEALTDFFCRRCLKKR